MWEESSSGWKKSKCKGPGAGPHWEQGVLSKGKGREGARAEAGGAFRGRGEAGDQLERSSRRKLGFYSKGDRGTSKESAFKDRSGIESTILNIHSGYSPKVGIPALQVLRMPTFFHG